MLLLTPAPTFAAKKINPALVVKIISGVFTKNLVRNRYKFIFVSIVDEMTFAPYFVFLGQQESQMPKLHRTQALQKNLFETLTLERYITLVLVTTTRR